MATNANIINAAQKLADAMAESGTKKGYAAYLALIDQMRLTESEDTQRQVADAAKGICDCATGIYDKFFRYHRGDDGAAYDMGWQHQNKTTQNEEVRFIGQV